MAQRRTVSPEGTQAAARLKAAWERFREAQYGVTGRTVTQEEAALAIGFSSQSALNQYLNGKIELNLDALTRICAYIAPHGEPQEIAPHLVQGRQVMLPAIVTSTHSGPARTRRIHALLGPQVRDETAENLDRMLTATRTGELTDDDWVHILWFAERLRTRRQPSQT
ncbi:helix-turn-helix domain-containing protein [Chitinimonas koreensis]|uniref:helix-turn-helix domain-containing protein n=1 Tax=Chitinimonas koreensis TaxID=356302 RepID=UPI0012FBA2BD|nr:helix-turn-helix transcriptional regulator [Chitinimonas koreensis]QNM94920.1 helix-turn-helix transcriptional regulator [Chitinimonas koreensis]